MIFGANCSLIFCNSDGNSFKNKNRYITCAFCFFLFTLGQEVKEWKCPGGCPLTLLTGVPLIPAVPEQVCATWQLELTK